MSISTRKLVIETAKLNVITAYSSAEALETLARYPAVNGVVMDAYMPDISCAELVSMLREIQPTIPIVAVGSSSGADCGDVDHFLESFEPARLLKILQTIDSKEIADIMQHEVELKMQQGRRQA